MQELFTKIVEHIPRFLSDLLELLTKPKRFLVSRARDETLTDGLIFLGIATVLFVILGTPMIGVDNLVQGTIVLVVAGVIVFAVSSFAVILSWRLVGGGATPSEHMVILAYSVAPILLAMVVVFLLGWPNVANAAAEDLPTVGNQWIATSMQIVSIGSFLWMIVVWGAYRTINNVSRARSVAAFVLAFLFSIPVNLLGTRLGSILGSSPPTG